MASLVDNEASELPLVFVKPVRTSATEGGEDDFSFINQPLLYLVEARLVPDPLPTEKVDSVFQLSFPHHQFLQLFVQLLVAGAVRCRAALPKRIFYLYHLLHDVRNLVFHLGYCPLHLLSELLVLVDQLLFT